MRQPKVFFIPILAFTLCLALAGVIQAEPLSGINIKWSQLPDMDQGTDNLSMHRNDGPVVADDFRSDGRPITGFHWWGSYLTNPGTGAEWDTGQGAERNVSFEISLHQDCPADDPNCGNGGPFDYSTPRDGDYFSTIVDVEEDFYGTTLGGENVYEYWLSVEGIPGPAFLGGTWNEVADEIYWVDFAWVAGQLGTDIADDVWGWHESFEHFLDNAVTTAPGVVGNPHIGPWALLAGEDKAFQVATVPEPSTMLLLGGGLLGLIGFRKKFRK